MTEDRLASRLEGFEERFTLRLEACEETMMRGLAELDATIDRRLRDQTWIMIGTVVTVNGLALGVGLAF